MRVQFWDAASNLHSHSYTGVDLSLGRWIKLKAWGLGVTFFFFFFCGSLWAWKGGRDKNQQSKNQSDESDRIWIKLLAPLRRDGR